MNEKTHTLDNVRGQAVRTLFMLTMNSGRRIEIRDPTIKRFSTKLFFLEAEE